MKNIYEAELVKLSEDNNSVLENQETVKRMLEENQKEQRTLTDNRIKLSKAEEAETYKIKAFEKTEETFKGKYKDFKLIKNLLFNEYDAKELEGYAAGIDEKTRANIALQEKLKVEVVALDTEKDNIKFRINETSKNISLNKEALIHKENELKIFNKETAKILEILRIKNLPLKVAENKEKLKEILQTENSKVQDTLFKEGDKLRELEETVNRYETGLIKLPKDVIKSFEDKGISFQYALSWLQNYKGSKEEKENLIKGNPFFPYGIILSAKDINLLKSESIDVYTSVPILSIRTIAIRLHELTNVIKETSSKVDLYRNIQEGSIVNEDKNILEAKLNSCEKQLGDNINRDKEMEVKLSVSLRNTEARLKRIAEDGKLGYEYKKVSFSEQKLKALKEAITDYEVQLKILNTEKTNLDKEIDRLDYSMKRELEDISKLGFEDPIAKELIKDSNFKSREKKIKEDIKQNGDIIKGYENEINKLKLIMQKLDNYKKHYIDKDGLDFEFNFDFNNLALSEKIIDELISEYESIKGEIYRLESKVLSEITNLHDKYRDKNRFIKERLFDFMAKERKISSHSDIESLIEIVHRKISTLEIELSHIKTEEEVVINEILRYSVHTLQELKTIDKKSNIKHLGKTQKLLEISIPEEIDEESLKIYIRQRVDYYGSFEGDYLNILESDIQSAELLSKLIGNINRIRVDIKKIEKSGLIRKNWKEALSQNSGGEKFVSMFILLSSLMSYMRKRETDIDNKEEKKILIMDNPFAKTNAEHLLEPMFQIAEKYNIQLLCFSGIGGSSVYNRFDKIYVAKVVEDKFRNKENVTFKAGSEETLELSDFTISKEQVSLF